jgi:hypothetical protein
MEREREGKQGEGSREQGGEGDLNLVWGRRFVWIWIKRLGQRM